MLNKLPNQLFWLLIVITLSCRETPPEITFTQLDSNTNRLMQAISIVDENVAWIRDHSIWIN